MFSVIIGFPGIRAHTPARRGPAGPRGGGEERECRNHPMASPPPRTSGGDVPRVAPPPESPNGRCKFLRTVGWLESCHAPKGGRVPLVRRAGVRDAPTSVYAEGEYSGENILHIAVVHQGHGGGPNGVP